MYYFVWIIIYCLFSSRIRFYFYLNMWIVLEFNFLYFCFRQLISAPWRELILSKLVIPEYPPDGCQTKKSTHSFLKEEQKRLPLPQNTLSNKYRFQKPLKIIWIIIFRMEDQEHGVWSNANSKFQWFMECLTHALVLSMGVGTLLYLYSSSEIVRSYRRLLFFNELIYLKAKIVKEIILSNC